MDDRDGGAAMYDDYRRGGNVFGSFVLGGLLGALIGLLFAPRSGRETREMIAERGQEYLDQAMDTYEDGREKLVEAYSATTGTATERAEDLKVKVDDARTALKERVDEASVAARSKVTEIGKDARAGIKTGAAAAKSGIDVATEKTKGALDFVAEKAASAGSAVEDAPAEPTA
jgi:gas vesicle protein